MTKIRIVVEIADDDLIYVARAAELLRVDPRKRWGAKKEMIEHARFYLQEAARLAVRNALQKANQI